MGGSMPLTQVGYVSAGMQQPQMVTVNSQPQRMMPPPPLAPAPLTVFSPSGSSPPISPPSVMAMQQTPTSPEEADMKVLLDMAVLSGNQKAVDALLRQAQQS